MWLTLLAVRNAIAVLMASLAIVVLGATSLGRLSMDLFPNINQPVVTIGTIYTGANVQDIEKTVTYPIEKAVSAVPGVRHVESRSRPGDLGRPGLVQLRRRPQRRPERDHPAHPADQQHACPSGIKQPFIVKFDLSNIPVCLITVSGGGLDEKQLYDLAYNTIEPQIERINGVASANVDGGKIRQIAVNLDRDLLYAKAHLGPRRRAVGQRLELPDAVGRHQDRHRRLQRCSPTTSSSSSKPMEDIVVRKVGDIPVRVRDLGYVSDS